MRRLRTSERRCDSRRSSRLGRKQLDDGVEPELPPDECRALDHRPLAGTQAVQPRREHALDRRRNLAVPIPPWILSLGLEELLHEQRVALGGPEDLVLAAGGELGRALPLLEKRAGIVVFQWCEHDRSHSRVAAAPARPGLQQLGPGEREDGDGRAKPVHEVFNSSSSAGSAQ